MSAAHTPGPWVVSPDHIFRNQADIFEIHWSAIGECITECVHGEANARLIAAAPDLLEALILQEEIYQMGILNGAHLLAEATRKRKAAIAKATGATT